MVVLTYLARKLVAQEVLESHAAGLFEELNPEGSAFQSGGLVKVVVLK